MDQAYMARAAEALCGALAPIPECTRAARFLADKSGQSVVALAPLAQTASTYAARITPANQWRRHARRGRSAVPAILPPHFFGRLNHRNVQVHHHRLLVAAHHHALQWLVG